MKITLSNTTTVTEINGVETRLWVGETEGGVQVNAFIAMIAVRKDADNSAFERELIEKHPRAELQVWPLRMIL
jgi:hypothetical protein